MQWHLYCQPVLGWGVNLLPWFVRSRAGLRESDTGLTKGTVLVCNEAVQCSDGQARVDTDLIHPVTRECATDAAGGLPMPLCHTAAKAPHRRCASSPGATGLSWGYRDWEGNTVSDGHYEAPCSPQLFRSSLMAFPVRS